MWRVVKGEMIRFLTPYRDCWVRRKSGGLVALIMASTLTACSNAPSAALTNVSGHLPDLAFRLTDDNGRLVTADDFRGAVSLIYFGFTRCPDECPTSMARAAAAVSATGVSARDIRTIFVTVDPAADTPAVLHRYLGSFVAAHPVGLSGDPDAILALVKRFRVAYRSTDVPSYLPAHGTAIYVFDRAGHARRMISPTDSSEAIVHDLEGLLAEARP